ncbi:MAG TPA: group I intron-associated PD-(D/E)XK endonuclease [Terriglobales bacterium]|nr:group I intron-associated PD-(D/E)XK endonuclease [Terriglobales bacterium]
MKLSTPPRPTRKQKGEIAEMAFAAKAMSLGMTVSRPYSETCYDFVLESAGRLSRIQVKSGWSEIHHGGYPVKMSNYLRAYRPDEIDFIAVYIVPEDTWYVVPVSAVRGRMTNFYPNVPRSRGALERFREAWELLSAPTGTSPRAPHNKGLSSRATARRFPRAGVEGPGVSTSEQFARAKRARAAWSALGEFLFR